MSSETATPPTPFSEEMSNNLSLLFERPFEPTFFPKDNGKKIIEFPADFYTERYKDTLASRNLIVDPETEFIMVKDLEVKPDLSFLDGIKRNEAFSLFLAKHQKISTQLTELFLKEPKESFFALAAYCRERTNPFLFQYSFSVALQHRPDTKHMPVSSAIKLFPGQFIDPTVISRFREESRFDVELRVSALLCTSSTLNIKLINLPATSPN